MNYKGFVLYFGHNGTHIQISIYSSSSEGCAAEVCVTPPRTSKCKFTHKHLLNNPAQNVPSRCLGSSQVGMTSVWLYVELFLFAAHTVICMKDVSDLKF